MKFLILQSSGHLVQPLPCKLLGPNLLGPSGSRVSMLGKEEILKF